MSISDRIKRAANKHGFESATPEDQARSLESATREICADSRICECGEANARDDESCWHCGQELDWSEKG